MQLEDVIGLGVAGNFAGHLEQAGEAGDFVAVQVAEAHAPKGLFPFYVPGGGDHFLHTYPLCAERIRVPAAGGDLQMEPEVALLCELTYAADGAVAQVRPVAFGAYNDCSIRREGARKISEKKNWGPDSKGFSAKPIPLEGFDPGGDLDHFRLASYLDRDGELHPYGVDSAVVSYSYNHGQLLDWLVDRMNRQADHGPLESIDHWLGVAGRPARALVSIGATRYTPFGERTFLRPGDRAIVVVYDERLYDENTIAGLAEAEELAGADGVTALVQEVV